MRFDRDTLLFSPTDLVNFLGCAHSTVLDLGLVSGHSSAPESEGDEYLELLQEKGIQHERRYLERLRNDGRTIADIATDKSHAERVELTRAAMRDGADVIYQGALLKSPWHGYSDFLIRVDGVKSSLGNYAYEVVDTKLSHSAKPKHVVQLCVYSTLVGEEQGFLPKSTHLVLGDGTRVTLKVEDFLHYCTLASRRFEEFSNPPVDSTTARPCGHCSLCRWAEKCDQEWADADDLSLVAGISRAQVAKLQAAGIATVRQLGSLEMNASIPRIQSTTLNRLRAQARLQTAKRDTDENLFELLRSEAGRGFQRLPQPDDGDLFFDIEGDPLYEDGGLDYLFGFDHLEDGAPRFTAFWAHSRDEEKAAFQALMDFITDRLQKYPNAHVYHYASYEESALKRMAMVHGTRENAVDDLLRRNKLVDLYEVVRGAVQISEPRYSIKNVEVFYATRRDGDVKSGGESVVVYERWRELKDPALLQQILDYNEVDCRSTRGCRDWLVGLRPEGTPWFVSAPLTVEENETAEAKAAAEAQTDELQSRLIERAPGNDLPWRELLGHLLNFHKREAKPEWWWMFKRARMSVEELVEDRFCLGDLTRDPTCPPVKDKRSTIHTFSFPEQEFRLKVGEKVLRAGTLEPAGEIVALDETARHVSLRVGPTRSAFEFPLSLVPQGPLTDQVMRDAIQRYAIAVADGREDEFPNITDLLRNVPGRDGSYSVIQGPPGAGKTYQSAKRIVALLADGKRVGVASTTHKAINNLLQAIEAEAQESGVVFRGVKKSSNGEQQLDGAGMIEDTVKNEIATKLDYALVGGTAYLFARPEMDRSLDYLFVDEAGQVSLANVIAMGMSAERLVLVGDQMQLAQPLKGTHPGGSGCSALEYLLGDLAVVPSDRGEFLPTTRRLHPDVCRFISDAVYDGKLSADPDNAIQQLLLSENVDRAVLAPSGIRFVPVNHDACSQDSEEEVARILVTYQTLMRQEWIDRNKVIRRITPDDVLVVSPYNMQCDRLRSVLPEGARVGTVDKFQGQEAAVVLVSMATSSGDDLPRDFGFLFSRNRLNVALSRARCLAVIFASPRLLEVSCSTVEQMRLVNTLCWAKLYSELAAGSVTSFEPDMPERPAIA